MRRRIWNQACSNSSDCCPTWRPSTRNCCRSFWSASLSFATCSPGRNWPNSISGSPCAGTCGRWLQARLPPTLAFNALMGGVILLLVGELFVVASTRGWWPVLVGPGSRESEAQEKGVRQKEKGAASVLEEPLSSEAPLATPAPPPPLAAETA